jgi:hypothetical protein
MNVDAITALLLAAGGFALGLREIMLSPANASFPKAPAAVRGAMFIFAASIAGGALMFGQAALEPGDYAGAGAMSVLMLSIGHAAYQITLTLNVYGQRYRPEVWARLNRAADVVKRSCVRRPMFAFAPSLHRRARR